LPQKERWHIFRSPPKKNIACTITLNIIIKSKKMTLKMARFTYYNFELGIEASWELLISMGV
jgi:hypothetical protein